MALRPPIQRLPIPRSPLGRKDAYKHAKNDRSLIERTTGIVIEFGRRSFLVPLLLLILPALCYYVLHDFTSQVTPRCL